MPGIILMFKWHNKDSNFHIYFYSNIYILFKCMYNMIVIGSSYNLFIFSTQPTKFMDLNLLQSLGQMKQTVIKQKTWSNPGFQRSITIEYKGISSTSTCIVNNQAGIPSYFSSLVFFNHLFFLKIRNESVFKHCYILAKKFSCLSSLLWSNWAHICGLHNICSIQGLQIILSFDERRVYSWKSSYGEDPLEESISNEVISNSIGDDGSDSLCWEDEPATEPEQSQVGLKLYPSMPDRENLKNYTSVWTIL